MKKRVVSVLLSLSMIAGILAGCGNSGKETTKDTNEATTNAESKETTKDTEGAAGELSGEVTVLTHRTDLVDTNFKRYAEKFNEKYPDITIKFEAITDYESDVAIRMSTTEYGDVLMIPNSIKNNEFADFFEPLGTVDELSQKYSEEFLYAKTDVATGEVYGLVSGANVQGVLYNKAVFEEAGITELPKSSEEFLDALRLIKENTDAIPYYTNYSAGWPLTAWADHAWGSVTGDADYHNNGILTEENPFSEGKPNYQVYKLLYDIIAEGLCENDPVTTDWENSKVMMNNGEIGCMMLGSWAISQMMEAGDNPQDIGYMAFPSNINGKQYATAGGDYAYAINIHSKNKEAARAWIDFMVDESGFTEDEGIISIVIGAPLPDSLSDFSGIDFVVDAPATEENQGLFDELSNESEIGIYADIEKRRIVEAAMGSTSESFDDIMNDWNERWTEVQKELGLIE